MIGCRKYYNDTSIQVFWLFSMVFVLGVTLSSCDDEIEVITDEQFGYNYFPLEIGKFRDYRVDSVTYDAVGRSFADTSYLREEMVSMDVDLEGDTVYALAISFKEELDDPWVQRGFALEQRDRSRAIRSAGNFRFVPMVFPVIEGTTWNGLIFIDNTVEVPIEGENIALYQGWSDHIYVGGSTSLTIDHETFDDVVTVSESASDGPRVKDLRESTSQYARNIGLVRRTQRLLSITCNGADDPCYNPSASWESQAEAGYTLIQELIAHN